MNQKRKWGQDDGRMKKFRQNNYAGVASNGRNVSVREQRSSDSFDAVMLINNNNFYTELDKCLLDFVNSIREQKSITDEKTSRVVNRLKEELQKSNIGFDDIRPFGSSVTGLAMKDSDIDIFIHFRAYTLNRMRVVKNALLRSTCFKVVEFVSRARVPIVKCIYLPTRTMCDISGSNPLGVLNTHLINLYFNLQPKLRPFVLFLKHWLKIYDIHGRGKFVTYALSWLVIFYLQQAKILPSVETLQELSTETEIVNMWNCSYVKDLSVIPHGELPSFFELLKKFFAYYADLDYYMYVISPYYGNVIHVSSFINVNLTPPCFGKYRELVSSGEVKPFDVGHYILLQDPFEHNMNIVKQTTLSAFNEFVSCCKAASNILDVPTGNCNTLRALLDLANATRLFCIDINMRKEFSVSGFSVTNPDLIIKALCYVLEKVFLLNVVVKRGTIEIPTYASINGLHFDNFREIEIKCVGNVDVISERTKYKMKLKNFSSEIAMEEARSHQCARRLDCTYRVFVSFVAPNKCWILRTQGPTFFLSFFRGIAMAYTQHALPKVLQTNRNVRLALPSAKTETQTWQHVDQDIQILTQDTAGNANNTSGASINVDTGTSSDSDIQVIDVLPPQNQREFEDIKTLDLQINTVI